MTKFQSTRSFHAKWTMGLATLGLAGMVISGGCGAQNASPSGSEDVAAVTGASGPPGSASASGAGAKSADSPATGTARLIQSASAVPRKIIYTATVELIADNFGVAQSNLLSLVKKHGGYLAETNIGGTPGTPRQGTWKIRIPENQFEAFMAAVVKLGELQGTQTESEDVTAEFYDLQARISNKQVEEKRLLDHLQRSTGKLSEILQVERELSRVRGEIEQMQGRLRLLANMTSLTTITVTLHEVKGYVPPKPATFGTQIARAFQSSLSDLGTLGKTLILVLVRVFPWAIVAALVGLPLWKVVSHFNKKP